MICVSLGNVLVARGRLFRLVAGRGADARWSSVVVGSLSEEMDV